MRKVESEALTWDYGTFKVICQMSGFSRYGLKRTVMRLAKELVIEFRGVKPRGRLKNGKTWRRDSTPGAFVFGISLWMYQ